MSLAASPPSPTMPVGAAVVRLPAEVDLAVASAIRDQLLSTINRDGSHLVVDALNVTFMDSTGVNALVRARDRAHHLGGSLHVVATAQAVTRVLQITQLTSVVGLVPSVEDAVRCIEHPETIHTCSMDGSGTDPV